MFSYAHYIILNNSLWKHKIYAGDKKCGNKLSLQCVKEKQKL